MRNVWAEVASDMQVQTTNTCTEMAYARMDLLPSSGAPEMISKNYLKFPEALRFQRELFGGSVKVSVQIARLMECVFSFAADVPQWVKDQASRLRQLVKTWKAAMIDMNFKEPAEAEMPGCFPPPGYIGRNEWNPSFTIEKADWSWGDDSEWIESFGGAYRSFCRRHQGGFQGYAKPITEAYKFDSSLVTR